MSNCMKEINFESNLTRLIRQLQQADNPIRKKVLGERIVEQFQKDQSMQGYMMRLVEDFIYYGIIHIPAEDEEKFFNVKY